MYLMNPLTGLTCSEKPNTGGEGKGIFVWTSHFGFTEDFMFLTDLESHFCQQAQNSSIQRVTFPANSDSAVFTTINS